MYIFSSLFLSLGIPGNACPSNVPYAYDTGNKCCETAYETFDAGDPNCDAGPLTIDSPCCLGANEVCTTLPCTTGQYHFTKAFT
jgi:hypothetical protein